jgi:hypothetical protein
MSRPHRRDPLIVAIFAAIAAAGCCVPETHERCIEPEEQECPTRWIAADLMGIEADDFRSDGVYYPARTYVDGERIHEFPAECCYVTETVRCDEMNGFGRPYVRGGRAVIAPPIAAPLRARPALRVRKIGAERKRRLAAAWLRRGALEHAAVASFGRFALDLSALGAPEALVRDAIRAIGDEARHARLAFDLAAAFGDPGHRPGTLAVDPSLCAELATFVQRTVGDGCVAETIGVAILEARAAVATDVTVRRVLSALARDEARHAELGWRALEWALAAGGDAVRRAATESLREALASHEASIEVEHASSADGAFGELGPDMLSTVARRAVHQRVAPRAAALGLEASCAS